MSDGWFNNDPNYHNYLKVGITVQDVLVELRDLHKLKKKTIKQLQKVNDPRLSFADFKEEERIKKQIADFKSKFDPFTIINSDPKLLEFQIDLHGGLRKREAVETFLKEEERIKKGLIDGTIKCNS